MYNQQRVDYGPSLTVKGVLVVVRENSCSAWLYPKEYNGARRICTLTDLMPVFLHLTH